MMMRESGQCVLGVNDVQRFKNFTSGVKMFELKGASLQLHGARCRRVKALVQDFITLAYETILLL